MTNSKKLFKTACFIGAVGLILILAVIVSNVAYPHIFFKIATPIGIGLVFLSVAILGLSWVVQVKNSLTKKDYVWAVVWLAIGLFIIIINFL